MDERMINRTNELVTVRKNGEINDTLDSWLYRRGPTSGNVGVACSEGGVVLRIGLDACLGIGLGGAALALGAHRIVFCTQ
jgi:hypothetical protein